MYVYYVCINIYIYIEREREGEKGIPTPGLWCQHWLTSSMLKMQNLEGLSSASHGGCRAAADVYICKFMYTYMYTYVHICIHVICVYIYIYIHMSRCACGSHIYSLRQENKHAKGGWQHLMWRRWTAKTCHRCNVHLHVYDCECLCMKGNVFDSLNIQTICLTLYALYVVVLEHASHTCDRIVPEVWNAL